jgi:hypothetical protein
MRALVLFCGTGSIDRALERAGFEVVSVDLEPKYNPTHCADILTWDYKQYSPDAFAFVWASPCCTHFSRARTTAKTPRDLDGACGLVAKALEIIRYFGCPYAFENPATGLLKEQSVVDGLAFTDVTYCRYGYSYKKATRIWHNLGDAFRPLPPCCRANPCHWFSEWGCHPMSAQRAPKKVAGVRVATALDKCSLDQLYSIPPLLCDEIANAALRANGRDTPET